MRHRWCGSLSGFKTWLIVELTMSSLGQTLDDCISCEGLESLKVVLGPQPKPAGLKSSKIGVYYLHNLKTRQCLLVSNIDLSMVSWHCQVVGYHAKIEYGIEVQNQIQWCPSKLEKAAEAKLVNGEKNKHLNCLPSNVSVG